MLVDRDRVSHSDNLEEIREIISRWGWWQMVEYLKEIGRSQFYDEELQEALEALSPIAEDAGRRIQAHMNGEEPEVPRRSPKKVAKVKRRKPR